MARNDLRRMGVAKLGDAQFTEENDRSVLNNRDLFDVDGTPIKKLESPVAAQQDSVLDAIQHVPLGDDFNYGSDMLDSPMIRSGLISIINQGNGTTLPTQLITSSSPHKVAEKSNNTRMDDEDEGELEL